MADQQNQLLQNIDKLAYAIAIVLGILVLGLGAFSDRGLGMAEGELQDSMAKIDAKRKEQKNLDTQPARSTVAVLEEQWRFDKSPVDTSWSVERPPLVVRKQKAPEPVPAIFEPARICRIELGRDKERKQAFLRVVGQMSPNNENVNIVDIQLFRAAGDSKRFERVRDFRGVRGDFEYDDYDVEPGKTYSYRCSARAETVDARLHPLAKPIVDSNVCGPTPAIPWDLHLMHTFILADASGNPVATVNGQYWDYARGRAVPFASLKVRRTDYVDPETKRFEIKQVIDTAGAQKVVVRDGEQRRVLECERGIRRDVASWEPIDCCSGAAAPEDDGTLIGTEDEAEASAGSAGVPSGEPAMEESSTEEPSAVDDSGESESSEDATDSGDEEPSPGAGSGRSRRSF